MPQSTPTLDPPRHAPGHGVHITLVIAGHRLRVTHTCGDWLMLRDPVDLPPGEGVLHVQIGQTLSEETVTFPDGIKRGRKRQPVQAVAEASLATR